MPQDIIHRFHAALPVVRNWIDQLLRAHEGSARAVSEMGFQRLPVYFPQAILERVKVVTVPRVPFPPLDQFGLPELSGMQQRSFSGITFRDTFFLQQGHTSESLHFHELVHVVQWERLGVDNFLLAYGLGLLHFDYEGSPLEQMAYTLQNSFDHGAVPHNLIEVITRHTDIIWQQAAPFLQERQSSA